MSQQTTMQVDKSKELRQTLDQLIEGYRTDPEKLAEMLAFKKLFYNYSINNTMLIYDQNQYATYVASYEDWKKKGYQVQKGQHGIKVFFPIKTEIYEAGKKDGKTQYRRVGDAPPEDQEKLKSGQIKSFMTTRFGIGNVFDISQTNCPPEDYPKIFHMGYTSDQHVALYDAFKSYVVSKGNSVIEKDLHSISLRGQIYPDTGEIQISDKLNDTERLSTLTHEYGHALMLADPKTEGKPESVQELEADCVSIMLQQEFGIDLTDSRKKHFTDHYRVCSKMEDFKLEDLLKNVNAAYMNVRKELDPFMNQAMADNEVGFYNRLLNEKVEAIAVNFEQSNSIYAAFKDYAEFKGYSVIDTDLQAHSLNSKLNLSTKEIALDSHLSDTERITALTQEFCEAMIYADPKSAEINPAMVDLKADCVAVKIQQHFGIPILDSQKEQLFRDYTEAKRIDGINSNCLLQDTNDSYSELLKELNPFMEQVMAQSEKTQDSAINLNSLTPEDKEEIVNRVEILRDYGEVEALTERDILQYDAIINERAAAAKKENVPAPEQLMEQHLKELYPTMKANAGYYILDEVPGYAVGFNPKAPEALVLWSVYDKDDYRNGIYRHTLDDFNYRDLVESGLHVERIQEILSEVGYAYEPMIAENVQEPEPEPAAKQPISKPTSKTRTDYKEQDAAVLEYLKRNVSILTVAKDMGFTPQQIGTNYTLKEHDSVRIYPETNSFNRFSTGVGGSTIDFAMHFGGLNEREAIQSLKDKYVGNRLDALPPPPAQPAVSKEPKAFELPEKADGKFARAYAYLTKTRCIDSDIVQSCMKDGLLYEDNKHNVVFVGKDAEGTPAYATRHTTMTNSSFKRDVAGSRQDIGFMVDNKADRLYVTEAPIDALSVMCLRKKQGQPVSSASYMATCGTGKDAALYYRLGKNPNIKEVVLANDNDEAGQKANKKMFEHLQKHFPQVKVSVLKPKGKDINEHLCKFGTDRCKPKNPKMEINQEVER